MWDISEFTWASVLDASDLELLLASARVLESEVTLFLDRFAAPKRKIRLIR